MWNPARSRLFALYVRTYANTGRTASQSLPSAPWHMRTAAGFSSALRYLGPSSSSFQFHSHSVDESKHQSARSVSTEMGKRPLLSVQPSRGLVDEMFQIVIMNLLPNQEVTLHSLHQSEDKDFWEAFGHYISDEHGTVTAYKILQNHPKVQKDRLAMLGLSFGGAVTLSLVTYSKIVKPQCCVCISGSHVVPLEKSLFEVFEEMKKNACKMRVNGDNQLIHRDFILPIPSDLTLKVDVGKIKCPLLLVNGVDDQNWPTVESAEDMEEIMKKAGNLHLLEVLTYPGAGHLIEPPYTPHIRASNFIFQGGDKIVMLWGGQTKPHAYAQEDAWKKILAFLQKHLYLSSNGAVKARL